MRAPRPTAIDLALCRSALYEALALGFRAPSATMVARLASVDGARGLVAAAALVDAERDGAAAADPAGAPMPADAAPPTPALATLVRRLAETDTALPALTRAYRDLFGHTVRSAAPAYETEYGGDDLFQQPHAMADVAGFYTAFGLVPAEGVAERPDHVSCECEFAMFLARKEALALERGDTAMLDVTRRAARLFLRDHLGRFVPSLVTRLRRVDPAGFYAALGALAEAVVRREALRLGAVLGPATLPLRTPIEDRVPMACGGCSLGADAGEADGA